MPRPRLELDGRAGGADRRQRRRQDQSARSALVPRARPRPAPRQARRDRPPRAAGAPTALPPGAWAVAARLATPRGRDPRSAPAATPPSDSGERRLVRIDGAPAKTQAALASSSCARLADAADGPAVHRRRRRRAAASSTGWCSASIRRMPHALGAYEQAMRERRAAAARRRRPMPAWLAALEETHGGARRRDRGGAARRWSARLDAGLRRDARGLSRGAARARRARSRPGSTRCRRSPPRTRCAAASPRSAPHRRRGRHHHASGRTAPISRSTMSAHGMPAAAMLDRRAEGAADRHRAGACAAAARRRGRGAAPAARRGRGASRCRAPRGAVRRARRARRARPGSPAPMPRCSPAWPARRSSSPSPTRAIAPHGCDRE